VRARILSEWFGWSTLRKK